MDDFWFWLGDRLGADRYAEHAICLTNDPLLIALYALSDSITAFSYLVMGYVLVRYSRFVVLNPEAKIMYGAFIVLCGLSHASKTMTLFWGIYRLDVMVNVAMAAVSALTAIFTIAKFPHDLDAQ